MILDKNKQAPISTNLIYMVIFGALSYILGLIKFQVPGIEGASTDLREIPLLIGVFHVNNPLYTIGMSFITSFGTPPDGSFLTTFVMHAIPLSISWYFARYLIQLKPSNAILGISWFLFVVLYYTVLQLPLLVLCNKLVGLNTDKTFISFYLELASTFRFELVTTAIISSLYLIQLEIRMILEVHKSSLEELVKYRTEQLANANEELKVKNEELVAQKEELSAALDSLKQTQSKLIQSEKMASLGTLTAGIAHEINNPLNFIAGGINLFEEAEADIMKNSSEEVKDSWQKACYMIKTGLEKTTNIVQALMTFSYRGTPRLSPTDINKIIDNTLLFLNSKLTSDIVIRKNYQLDKEVPAYSNKIHQVLMNILDNAIFAVSLNDIGNTKEIDIITYQNKDLAFIEITNNGPKIPEQNLKQIFDPFFTTKDPGKGTGLGLSISYTLIQEHKGTINVHNTENGVSFVIEMPLSNKSA